MTGLGKSFGATSALEGVDLAVEPATVHALLGENGAGKSTLMKILSGVYRPDAGRMLLDGEPYAPADPLEARCRGVAMIYQELALAPHLTAAANILLGLEPARRGWIRRRELDQRAGDALRTLGHGEIPLQAPAGSLSLAARQVVELARALVIQAGVVVLDEPTSSLAADDVPRGQQIPRYARDDNCGGSPTPSTFMSHTQPGWHSGLSRHYCCGPANGKFRTRIRPRRNVTTQPALSSLSSPGRLSRMRPA